MLSNTYSIELCILYTTYKTSEGKTPSQDSIDFTFCAFIDEDDCKAFFHQKMNKHKTGFSFCVAIHIT